MPEMSDEQLGRELREGLDDRARSVEIGDPVARVALARSRATRRRAVRPTRAIGVAAAVVVAVASGLGFGVWRSGQGADLPAAASMSASATATVSPTETPSIVSSPTPTPTIALPTPSATPLPAQPVSPHIRPTGSSTLVAPVSTLLADGRVLFVDSWNLVPVMGPGAELYDSKLGKFVTTGPLLAGRRQETVTGLKDGRALVVGGEDIDTGNIADTEAYDPRTGAFTVTGAMSTPRLEHTATLLSDGRVLIVGGARTWMGDGLASAEIYDPRTGKFTPTGSMSAPRYDHTATLLQDGRVLVVGGASASTNGDVGTASAEIYDPRTGEFTPTGSMSVARYFHTATLLADGRVLVAGGTPGGMATDQTGGTISSTAEVYDPKSGTFAPTGSMTVSRAEHTATLMRDGRVLVVGGVSGPDGARNATASIEIYDPKTGGFTAAGVMASPRLGHAATLLPDGLVLIVGGVHYGGHDYIEPDGSGGVWSASDPAELYQP